jgi:hypothetical protein
VTGKIKKNEMRDEMNKLMKEVDPDDWEVELKIFS